MAAQEKVRLSMAMMKCGTLACGWNSCNYEMGTKWHTFHNECKFVSCSQALKSKGWDEIVRIGSHFKSTLCKHGEKIYSVKDQFASHTKSRYPSSRSSTMKKLPLPCNCVYIWMCIHVWHVVFAYEHNTHTYMDVINLRAMSTDSNIYISKMVSLSIYLYIQVYMNVDEIISKRID